MSDRAAYTLAFAILTAGAMVAAAVILQPTGRYALSNDGALIDTASGSLLSVDELDAENMKDERWRTAIAPVGTPAP